MKSAERVWNIWVIISEVEHTSEGLRKSAERSEDAEGLWKSAEGLWRSAEGLWRSAERSGNADKLQSVELSVP